MTQPDRITDAELERELADELRALLEQSVTCQSDGAALRAAIALVRDARRGLGNGVRTRWFDGLAGEGRPGANDLAFNTFSLFRGRANAVAPPLVARLVQRDDGTRAVEARVICNQLYEGPPHGVHGGFVAGLFDDVLGSTIRLVEGPSAVTGTLEVKYRRITPLDTELVFSGWVEHEQGRRIHSRATCHADGVLTAEATALFVRVDMSALVDKRADYRPR
jgi:acyl-coenzyme A thioesterase PaaI-like protein